LITWIVGKKWVLWLIGAAIIFATGWTVNGWRWEAKEDRLVSEYRDTKDQAVAEAENRRATVARAYAEVDARYTKEMADAQAENDALRRDVAAGRKRLLVNARCPAAAAVPAPAGGAGVDPAPAPELGPDAVEAYHDLRRQHRQVTDQLLACQDMLMAGRQPK
jgi:prophage endopeptidase